MDDEINNSKDKKGTTVVLEQDAYSMILEKQMEIFNKTKKRISIQELVSSSVKKGVNLIPILDSSASQV